MLEKYKKTSKHSTSNESLIPVDEIIRRSADAAVPNSDQHFSTDVRIDQAPSPSVAFKEILLDTDGDPAQIIKNIDLALKHFGADEFTDEERAVLSKIVVKKSDEIIHKSVKISEEEELAANDFIDPIVLGSAVDTLHELEGDTDDDTGPILQGIVSVAENISNAHKNADHVVKLDPEEAAAVKEAVQEFKRLPPDHHEKFMYFLDNRIRRVADAKLAYHELQSENSPKNPQSYADIRRAVNRFFDRRLRQRRALGVVTGNIVTTSANPVTREKHVA